LTVGAYGVMRGVCSNTAGAVVVPSFTINTIIPPKFGAHYPRVKYNAAATHSVLYLRVLWIVMRMRLASVSGSTAAPSALANSAARIAI